jgi:hypothetical protein
LKYSVNIPDRGIPRTAPAYDPTINECVIYLLKEKEKDQTGK